MHAAARTARFHDTLPPAPRPAPDRCHLCRGTEGLVRAADGERMICHPCRIGRQRQPNRPAGDAGRRLHQEHNIPTCPECARTTRQHDTPPPCCELQRVTDPEWSPTGPWIARCSRPDGHGGPHVDEAAEWRWDD